MWDWRSLRCSFCRRTEHEVAKLVAGPKVYICDRCVAAASRIMKEHRGDPATPAERDESFVRRLLKRVFPGSLRQLCRGSATTVARCAPSP